MTRAERRRLLLEERSDLHAFLLELDPPDWETTSLCRDWTVRDVAAHLSSAIGVTRRGLLKRSLRYGTGTDRANARSATAWRVKGEAGIIAPLADPSRIGLGFFYPGWALCEAVVHHQDMRRPLNRPRTIPEERLRVALDVLIGLPMLTGATRASRRVTIRATDIEWTHGSGPEVTGLAESILMALAGRNGALAELWGDGCKILASGQK